MGTRGPRPIGTVGSPGRGHGTGWGQKLVRRPGWGLRWQNVVEEPVVFVVVDKQHGRLPEGRILPQCLQHPLLVDRPIGRAGGRMLAPLVGGDDPGDLREGARPAIGDELVEHMVDAWPSPESGSQSWDHRGPLGQLANFRI